MQRHFCKIYGLAHGGLVAADFDVREACAPQLSFLEHFVAI
jgi:hypothetical protein